jgi:hypothetical protein
LEQTELATWANISLNIIVDFEMERKTPTAFSQAATESEFRDTGIDFTSVNKVVLRRFTKGDKVQFKQFEPHIGERLKFKVVHDGEVGRIVVVESPSLSSTLGDYRVSVRFKTTIAAGIPAGHFQLVEAVHRGGAEVRTESGGWEARTRAARAAAPASTAAVGQRSFPGKLAKASPPAGHLSSEGSTV